MKNPVQFPGPIILAACLALAFAVDARAGSYQSTILSDTPIAYYALNPGQDGTSTAPDLTGNGNDGLIAGSLAAGSGPSAYITNAAYFDGGEAIDLSQSGNPGLLNFTGPITLEAWVQPSSSSFFGDIVAKGYYSSSPYYEIVLRANGPYGQNYYGNSGSVAFQSRTRLRDPSYSNPAKIAFQSSPAERD